MARPSVGLALILIKDEKVLMGKRKGSHGVGTWGFPGGHLEWFEELMGCAYRELEEETGLGRKNISYMEEDASAATNDFFPEENKHYITLFMRAKLKLEDSENYPIVKNMEPEKLEEWKWFEWNRFPSGLFLPVSNLVKQGYNPFDMRRVG